MLKHKGTQTIETPRLILRKAITEDAQAMFRNWASDPEVTKYLTWPTHDHIDITQWVLNSWVEEYKNPDYYQWMIVPKDGVEPIGTISVVRKNDENAEAEIGYCIGKAWWHKGFTTEAMAAVIKYLFDEVGMRRITARHDPNNPNSGKVMLKCGMRYLGTTIASDQNNQGICDTAHYEILKDNL